MTTKRQVFYSFHYEPDNWRASQVRNIGFVEGNRLASDNDWETIKRGGDNAIKRWIDSQMQYRTCTVVLVGSHTANRKWINYEITKSWKEGKGVVGIRINRLQNQEGFTSGKGYNPFDYTYAPGYPRKKLSRIVKCYDPSGNNSKERYAWIERNLSATIEEAINIRRNYS